MGATNFINNCLNQDVLGANKDLLLPMNERMNIEFLDATFSNMISIMNKAYSLDEYGSDKANKFWDSANDLMYLQVYLNIIALSIKQDLANGNCSLLDYDTISERYKIDCIRKYFSCISIDIDPLLSIFGIDRDMFDGIGYMGIEEGDCNKIFEIL